MEEKEGEGEMDFDAVPINPTIAVQNRVIRLCGATRYTRRQIQEIVNSLFIVACRGFSLYAAMDQVVRMGGYIIVVDETFVA